MSKKRSNKSTNGKKEERMERKERKFPNYLDRDIAA